MDDDSDDGNLPGQSFFKRKNDEQEEPDNNINENYDENDGNQYYQSNDNYDDYENNDNNYDQDYNNNFTDEQNYNNEQNSSNYNNSEYDYEYVKKSYNNHNHPNKYSNINNRDNTNNNYRRYNNNHYQKYNLTKTKEGYLTSFGLNFKLWLMLVIKKTSIEKKIIEFTKNEKINKEVIDSFLKFYDIEANIKKENEKNNLNISIKDFELKKLVGDNYIVQFSIIIKDKIEIFFVDKYIEMKVKGEINSAKFTKFHFSIKQYKLSLDSDKIKNDENKNNIIENIDSDEIKSFIIGMCPEYSINNQTYKNLYTNIYGVKNIKDPHKEIVDCFDNLINNKYYK